jgi:hypothetical protein
MAVLMVMSVVAWGRSGNRQIGDNWNRGRATCTLAGCIVHQIFNGVCLGMLGLTGFECTFHQFPHSHYTNSKLGIPSYAASIRPGRFPSILRNLHYPAIILNTLLMLFALALVPLDTILAGANILSVLAETVCLANNETMQLLRLFIGCWKMVANFSDS